MDAETLKAIQYFRLGGCWDEKAVENAEVIIKALEKAEWNAVESVWLLANRTKTK